jgi:outer membrane protein TolC
MIVPASRTCAWAGVLLAASLSASATAQSDAQSTSAAPASTWAQAQPAAPASTQVISLEEAIHRAQSSAPAYALANADARSARLDRSIARAALLPSVVYLNQYLYTESNGTTGRFTSANSPGGVVPVPVVFIANNAVHEYTSQAAVTETLGLKSISAAQVAGATAARAAAELEIARRGLVAAVVGLYFGVSASERKLNAAQRAADEATSFADLTAKREAGREVAHADVVKAQLQLQQRQRDLSDARLAADRARLELGVLLFNDPRTPYTTQPRSSPPPLPARADVEASAAVHNAELRSAFASLRASNAAIVNARAAYLPDLVLNYNYGIDAAVFATRGREGENNLGYSATATLAIPVWDWLATEHRVKQAEIRRDAAKVALSAAERRAIAALDEGYAEAATAQQQLASEDLSVQTAAESLRLTKLRYANGEATALEVVDAQTALTTAENLREDGVVRYETSLANLQTLTGTL